MKARISLYAGGWAVALAVLGLLPGAARAQKPFKELVGDVKVGEVKKADTLELPFILWGGDIATFHGNGGLATKPGTIFQKQGLNLKLTRGDDFAKQVRDYMEGKTPFLRGTISMIAQASEVVNADPRTQPVVFLQMTWSKGDHMVARDNLKTLNDLKGKKIALQEGGPHVGMLGDVLGSARLKWDDIKVVWTPDVTGPNGPVELFRKDPSVDACFAITPDMAGLTGGLEKTGTGAEGTVKGAHVVTSTAYMKRSIADVYACRKDFYEANKPMVEKLAASYLKAGDELLELKKKGGPAYKAVLKMTQDIYGKKDIPSEDDADGLVADAGFVGLEGNIVFFESKNNPSGFDAREKAALDTAAEIKSIQTKKGFLKPGFKYADIKKLGGAAGETDLAAILKKVEEGGGEVVKAGGAIVNFTINFGVDQADFPEAKYGADFQEAINQASLYGNAVMEVRGHADLSNVIIQFVRAGLEKGWLKRTGNAGNFEYFINGKKFDLGDTTQLIEQLGKQNFDDVKDDPRETMKALQTLSDRRADSVKQAVLKYATVRGAQVTPKQLQVKGVGIREPIMTLPRGEEDRARNRRVEFRLSKKSLEDVATNEVPY